MKKIFLFGIIIISFSTVFSQENKDFDTKLAKDVGADDYGMKTYVFCILKTGTNSTATAEERQMYFEGHMANINKLADEKKIGCSWSFHEK